MKDRVDIWRRITRIRTRIADHRNEMRDKILFKLWRNHRKHGSPVSAVSVNGMSKFTPRSRTAPRAARTAATTDLWLIATLRMETWICRYMRLVTRHHLVPSTLQRWIRPSVRQCAAHTLHAIVFVHGNFKLSPCQLKCYYPALSLPPARNMGWQQGVTLPVTSLILRTCSRWPYKCCQHTYLHNNTLLSIFEWKCAEKRFLSLRCDVV
jgi:hypothetical protein